MERRHEEIEELLGAFALDAVDDDERAAVSAHLATCPRCRAEVDAHREVASYLAQTGAPAPDAVWDRIAAAIDGEPPPPLRLVLDSGAPKRRWWRRTPFAVAAAIVAAVALLGAGAALRGGSNDDRDAELAAAVAVFESPDARTAALLDDAGVALARAAVLPSGDGYLLAGALPDLPDGIYQLWGTDGETVVSLGSLGSAPDVVPFVADPAHVTLMVSVEDHPVEAPTSAPVVAGDLA